MQRRLTIMLPTVVLSAFLAGCAEDAPISDYVPEKPAQAGRMEDLQDRMWHLEGGDIYFHPGGRVQFRPEIEGAQPFYGTYALRDGILEVSIAGLPPLMGTWDGTTLIIDGKTCTPREARG